MSDSGSHNVPASKETNKVDQVADILAGKASIDDQDGSIKKLFGIKEPKVVHDFIEENQRLVPHEGEEHELSNEEQGLDDKHKSHMLLMSAADHTNPLAGEIPTNNENANTVANILASPHPHGAQ